MKKRPTKRRRVTNKRKRSGTTTTKKRKSGGGVVLKVRNKMRKKFCPKGTTALRKGEKHAPCMNYAGPGTDVEGRIKAGVKPVNATDRAAQQHDLDYNSINKRFKQGKITKAEAAKLTRAADKRMLASMKKANKRGENKSMFDKFSHHSAAAAMKGKIGLEKLKILNPTKFSVSG